jgi:2-polyprenyl-3-methyl-5-hydroxy-6-metoxy-1,4-benzoquinol methylase
MALQGPELEARRASAPLTVVALGALLRYQPAYRSVVLAALRRGDDYWGSAEARCREILHLAGGDPEEFERSVLQWIRFSFEFFRKQQQFLRTGHYAATEFAEVQRQLYDDPERMEKFYLVALMFSFVFSSNYIAFFDFFRRELLPRLGPASSACDVGCGHGVYLTEMLRRGARGIGLDISPASLATTRRLLAYHAIPGDRYRLELGDLHGTLPVDPASQDAVTCFEVIEHLEDPAHALVELRRILRPGGALCLSTAIRMESVDHLHLFREPGEVEGLIEGAGLTIVASECIPLTTEDIADRAVRDRLIADPAVPLGYVALTI